MNGSGRLRAGLAALGAWLIPPACVVCGGPAPYRDLCRDCALALPWNTTCCERCALPLALPAELCGECVRQSRPWDRATAAFVYRYPVDSLLRRLKFSGHLASGRVLGELLAEWLAARPEPRPDLLIPVPLHWRRQLRRRFNQAGEIARPLGARLGIPIAGTLCRRHHRTPEQSGLAAPARRRNLKRAFRVCGDVSGANIAIVDDVMTTASTVGELSRELRRAGAGRIDVWTVARTPSSIPSSAGRVSVGATPRTRSP